MFKRKYVEKKTSVELGDLCSRTGCVLVKVYDPNFFIVKLKIRIVIIVSKSQFFEL